MTRPPDEPDDRASDQGSGTEESATDNSRGIYRRPRRRGDGDLRYEVPVSSQDISDEDAAQTDRASSIYTPPRRRSVRRDQEESRPGVWSRITGRHRLDEIRSARYEPYTYESNEQNVKWASIVMGIWCLALLWLAWTDCSNSGRYQEWVEQGITVIPPSADLAQQIESARTYAQREGGEEFKCADLGGFSTTDECPSGEMSPVLVSNFVDEQGLICWHSEDYVPEMNEEIPDDEAITTGLEAEEPEPINICTAVWTSYGLLEFARQSGLDCPDVNAVVSTISGEGVRHPGCERAFSYAEDFQASQDRSRLIWLLVIFILIFVAFPYLSLIHRASRNLLPLKSEGQKHTPEWGVLHHFIPILNLFRPGTVLRELYKGSDPEVSTDDVSAWKRAGKARAIVYLWWILWIAGWVFNPITVPRYVNPQTLPEVINANDLLILSDVLLISLGVVAVLMLRQLHVWQEMRFEKIGLITVTPPPPVDPLAEALKNQEEKQREKDEKKKRRGR